MAASAPMTEAKLFCVILKGSVPGSLNHSAYLSVSIIVFLPLSQVPHTQASARQPGDLYSLNDVTHGDYFFFLSLCVGLSVLGGSAHPSPHPRVHCLRVVHRTRVKFPRGGTEDLKSLGPSPSLCCLLTLVLACYTADPGFSVLVCTRVPLVC